MPLSADVADPCIEAATRAVIPDVIESEFSKKGKRRWNVGPFDVDFERGDGRLKLGTFWVGRRPRIEQLRAAERVQRALATAIAGACTPGRQPELTCRGGDDMSWRPRCFPQEATSP